MDSVATMPNKLKIDWNLAFNLFTQGLTFKDIAPKVGCLEPTLRKHAARHNWTEQVSQARLAVSQVVQDLVRKEPLTVQKRAEQWIDATACDIERTVATLSKLPVPQNLDGLRKHEEVWGMHVKRGRSTFGLDQQGTNVQINIGRFGKASIEPVQDHPQVIDIPPYD